MDGHGSLRKRAKGGGGVPGTLRSVQEICVLSGQPK